VSDGELLDQQRAYYRRRAPHYDDWWQRRGRYDGGDAERHDWEGQVAEVEAALDAFGAAGDVLELAGGTGWWTARLARSADRLTVIDSSPEALTISRRRVERPDVEWVESDVFSWRPERRYDVVFFSFWLSHVPRDRFETFWELVGQCLALSGRAFFIDNRHDPTRTRPDPYLVDADDDIQLRRLDDGTEHRVVKVFYEPAELTRRLEDIGWRADIAGTRRFVYGSARPGRTRTE